MNGGRLNLEVLLQLELIDFCGRVDFMLPRAMSQLEQLQLALLLNRSERNANSRDGFLQSAGCGTRECRGNLCEQRISSIAGGRN
jgi:hypothetical protein